jgi:DMSO/TMAO reductase YedYZ molybdopterin-dependent catalytic subunit
VTLPPGQRAVEGFPRFGAHFGQPPPDIPDEPEIEIRGPAVSNPLTVPLAHLAGLPRRRLTADFHCVAGWSATGLLWEGVAFEDLHRLVIQPALCPGASVTHVVFRGLDGFRSYVEIEDALAADVLIAEHLDGRPLDGDHGAPVRLVSPSQYGFISVKHLCSIELHTTEPRTRYHPSLLIEAGLQMVKPHRRARVWEEERHRYAPAWVARPVYRQLIGPFRRLAARRSGR